MRYSYFGTRLKHYRTLHNESLGDIANAVGVSRSYILKLEKGESKPSENIINSLISHFSLSADGAFELLALAGYKANTISLEQLSSDSTEEKTQRKEVKSMDNKMIQPKINLEVPKGTPVLYTDSAFVTLSPYGLVIDYAQTLGATNQQMVVSRLGMSIDHAEALVKVMTQKISEAKLLASAKKKKERASEN